MKCPFCAAESGPQANFCSDCGSPLYLKVCPKCETVNEKTATACMKCGGPLAAQDESTVLPVNGAGAAVVQSALAGETAVVPPESSSVNEHASPVDTGNKEWKALLQEVEEEVHRQLDAEPQLARENSSDAATTTQSSAAHSAAASSVIGESAMASEAKRFRSPRSAVILLFLLVMVGGAIAAYYFRPLAGVTATAKPATSDQAGPTTGPPASPPAKPHPLRDEAKNSEETTSTAPRNTPAGSNPSAADPSPPSAEGNSAATVAVAPAASEVTTGVQPGSASRATAPSSSAVPRGGSAAPTSPSDPVAAKARPAPKPTKRADIAEIVPGEGRAVIETPTPRAMEAIVPEHIPCTEAMQALALCAAPTPQ
jgi:Double zinc ribbon